MSQRVLKSMMSRGGPDDYDYLEVLPGWDEG